MGAHGDLGPGAEFDAVRELLRRWGDLAVGIGDDAATVEVPDGERLLVSTDASIEGVHFRRGWLTSEEIGHRATVSALSDLAAMGARALGVLVALSLPIAWRAELSELAQGIGEAVRTSGARIVGGDLTDGAQLAVTVTVLGSAVHPIGRGGARAGDAIYVTGWLGGPLRALRSLSAGSAVDPRDRERFARPTARLAEGRWLAAHGATAMIDVSDGLLADLRHVAAASAARLSLDARLLPCIAGATTLEALTSGEEYELAVAAPPGIDADAFLAAFGVPLTAIGVVDALAAADAAGVTVHTGGVALRVDLPAGHDHFSP